MRPDEASPTRLQEALGSKYHVLRWIGGGGMAQVYLARNRTTGGLFAVKVLSEQLAGDESVVARFLQEARTSAALSGHPNIVSIFDVGQFENTHYIIMQYVEGEDLKTYLKRRGKLAPEEAARIVEQVADALVFAHSHMVVHRDLKPSNVKIQNSGRIVVLDFGIAKAGDAPTQLTTAGQRVGTPYYMSPEYFATGECDGRSDLYSLGIVFFELLTGYRPFDGDSVQEIEAAHRSRPAPSPCQLEPSVPEAFGRVVLRLLEKRPEHRYQNASELIADIRQAIGTGATAGSRTEAAPPPPESVAPAPAAPEATSAAPEATSAAPEATSAALRKRTLAPALAIAGALIVVVAGGFFFRSMRAGAEQNGERSADVPRTSTSQSGGTRPGGDGTVQVEATTVANTAYKAFCDQTGHPYPEPLPNDPNYFYAKPEAPVLNVSYDDAAAFANWAGKRLPSAPEWDKAHPSSGSGPAVAEWTSTAYTPSDADTEAFRKLAGAAPRGDWRVIKGEAPLPGLPSQSQPRGIAIGFRCVKDAARR
jgi:hypothetical protein